MDDAVGVETDPVADDGELDGSRVASQAGGDVRATLACGGEHVVLAAMLGGDAAGDQAVLVQRGEGGIPVVVPT